MRPKRGIARPQLLDLFAQNVAETPPVHPTPLTFDGLIGLLSADDTGANFASTIWA